MRASAIWLIAATGVLMAGTAQAQTAPSAARTVQLSKVIEDTETSDANLSEKVGTLCWLSGKMTLIKHKIEASYERFDNLFTDEARKNGFNVVTTSQDLFASSSDRNKADFLVGATLRPASINICSSVNGVKGDVAENVEWQIYDRQAQKVVATVVTTGSGKIDKFDRQGFF